ncbi:hypothetical protein SAMD00023353_1502020 [Rosellinia necatrix]|uniref:Uncharacterized protein n=1 Tax=Rosellinia necatrix TaxID=77044 RepID=A0A1W2TRF3_ROSNE|nr:hypothetical protein SAMD00023353_1502020 [Rosellinia necatrix]
MQPKTTNATDAGDSSIATYEQRPTPASNESMGSGVWPTPNFKPSYTQVALQAIYNSLLAGATTLHPKDQEYLCLHLGMNPRYFGARMMIMLASQVTNRTESLDTEIKNWARSYGDADADPGRVRVALQMIHNNLLAGATTLDARDQGYLCAQLRGNPSYFEAETPMLTLIAAQVTNRTPHLDVEVMELVRRIHSTTHRHIWIVLRITHDRLLKGLETLDADEQKYLSFHLDRNPGCFEAQTVALLTARVGNLSELMISRIMSWGWANGDAAMLEYLLKDRLYNFNIEEAFDQVLMGHDELLDLMCCQDRLAAIQNERPGQNERLGRKETGEEGGQKYEWGVDELSNMIEGRNKMMAFLNKYIKDRETET